MVAVYVIVVFGKKLAGEEIIMFSSSKTYETSHLISYSTHKYMYIKLTHLIPQTTKVLPINVYHHLHTPFL